MSRVNNDKRYDYLRWYPWAKDRSLAPAGAGGNKTISLLTPRVSVIIPVGPGHGRYAQDAVDSVAAQSYRQWECIVVNDSGEPLHLPPWVRQIQCDARDAGAARNIGIAAANTDYFLPLDADDFLQPEALQFFLSAYVEAGGGDRIVYSDFFEDPIEVGKYSVYRCPEFSCQHLRNNGVVYTVTALTPVSLWKQVGGYAENLAWEDMDFQLRCAEVGACTTHIKAPLFTYRKFTGHRRNWEGTDELEHRKAEMVKIWGDYLVRGKDFMGCGCARSTIEPPISTPAMVVSQRQFGDVVLVEYLGAREGNVQYRGATGAIYQFSKGEPLGWVDGKDAAMFANHRDFRLAPSSEQAELTAEPVLVA